MLVHQHFRDGNDPSRSPGAEMFLVRGNSDFVAEREHRRVTHRPTGDVIEYQLEDLEMGAFMARLIDGPGNPLLVRGYAGRLDRAEGSLLAFNVISTVRLADGAFLDIPVSLRRIGKFLNAMASVLSPHSYTDPVLIIDNRAIKEDGSDPH